MFLRCSKINFDDVDTLKSKNKNSFGKECWSFPILMQFIILFIRECHFFINKVINLIISGARSVSYEKYTLYGSFYENSNFSTIIYDIDNLLYIISNKNKYI